MAGSLDMARVFGRCEYTIRADGKTTSQ
ncbi:hypothetical protein RSAG8_00320, partial [Rhizoctonia solani AG-8 WAC10335]